MHEQYVNEAAFLAHTQTPHYATWVKFCETDPFTSPVHADFYTEEFKPGEAAPYRNAVTDDIDLQNALKSINPAFGDLVARVAGEVWGQPYISQKFKAFITIALDIANQSFSGPGVPYEAHIRMALSQGATFEEIEELLLFCCVYCGFNKVAGAFGRWNEIKEKVKMERESH